MDGTVYLLSMRRRSNAKAINAEYKRQQTRDVTQYESERIHTDRITDRPTDSSALLGLFISFHATICFNFNTKWRFYFDEGDCVTVRSLRGRHCFSYKRDCFWLRPKS